MYLESQAAMEAAVVAAITRMSETIEKMQGAQEEQEKRMMDLMEKFASGKKGGPGPGGREDVTTLKGFTDLLKNDGKPETFDNWRFKMHQFLTKDETYVDLLKWIEGLRAEVVPEVVEQHGKDKGIDMKWYNSQLWAVLTMNCIGDALGQIKNLEQDTEVRGVNAWLRVTRDFRGMSAQRLIGLVGRVFAPTRVKRIADVTLALEKWESNLIEYQHHGGTVMPEFAKMYAIRHFVPEELEKDLMRMCTTLGTFYEYKRYIEEQVAMSKPAHFNDAVEKRHKVKAEVRDVDALLARVQELKEETEASTRRDGGAVHGGEDDLDDLEAELYALKGVGKGGKGGRFEGYCHHCGKYGHRVNQCWSKDEEMEQLRKGGKSGGKGSKGKSKGWGKGGQGKSSGFGYDGKGNKGKGGAYWFDAPAPGFDPYQQAKGWPEARLMSLAATCGEIKAEEDQGKCSVPPGLGRWAPLMNNDIDDEYNDDNADEVDEQEIPVDEYPELEWTVKQKVKKNRMPKYDKKKTKCMETMGPAMSCCPLIAEMPRVNENPYEAELHPCTQEQWKSVDPHTGWTRIRAVVDSGASDSCSPNAMEPNVKSRESVGSRRGLVYNGAAQGGRPLTNDGEKDVLMMTEDGRMLATCWQTVEVARPLLSVRQIAQQGNRVTFGAIGGEIYNLQTGKVVKFGMEGNVYVLDLWIPPNSGFTRPGR